MDRRTFIRIAAGGACIALLPSLAAKALADEGIVRITRTDEEWRKLLTSAQYRILREAGTERPFSSPLDHEWRTGTYACAGCGLALFPSNFKYDSGTGWPSFYDVLPGHVETRPDLSFAMVRTEYHCARCGGHQGHLFHDGPRPTGLRYCNNGLALHFIPEKG
ncbi:MAG TPA: peptide-methionine (R)-S-oxide reductase MsrB [Gallionellaceae bacterium]|nr:peptide-methionine (R)-S-oxide reductase MsrB [Gallionellaceae bacterium]